ncbi:hypothetical protein [Pseudoduganella sp. R-34]|uniref:hypothetical protein n=1 Tax=unclassified Pseudoduganella TaxID=2637179 RepID=UPI003CFA5D01
MEQLTPDDRTAAQEKALDAVNCELALLRQHMDARFASMQASFDAQFASMQASTDAQFTGMRQYIDDGFVKLRLEMQLYTRDEIAKAVAPLQAQIDALRDHVDRISRWGFGMMAMILIGELALLARGLLG